MPPRRHYPFRGNPDFTNEAYEMPETKTPPPPPNEEKEEDQRGGGVSEHFRAKEAETEESGRWNPYFRDCED